MRIYGLKNAKKIYFLGIGGVSMSALAQFLFVQGYEVCGSDAVNNEYVQRLHSVGIKTFQGVNPTREELLSCDVLVYTDAIAPTNAEYACAIKQNKQIISRAELLKMVCEQFPHSISVAGSHGKTTCTSLCAHALKSCGVPFTAHIGGEDTRFGNFYYGGDEYFLTETCEYKRNLLKMQAERAILLNVDNDHMECYTDETDLTECFYRYCQAAKTAFVCADDPRCKAMGDFVTFGIKNPLADYRAIDLRANGEKYSFTVEEYGNPLCRVRLQAIGRHNIYNALAAFSVMRSYGFDEREIAQGLQSFQAVKRRFEKIGTYNGASLICDYAHHPKEIAATLATAKNVCKGKLYTVFQPHTYSRTKLLMNEFVETLKRVENLVIFATYPAREKFDAAGSAQTLCQKVGSCLYAENLPVLTTWLKSTVKEGDTVLFLGAGDIYYAAQYIAKSR